MQRKVRHEIGVSRLHDFAYVFIIQIAISDKNQDRTPMPILTSAVNLPPLYYDPSCTYVELF